MPTKPTIYNYEATASELLNAIRNEMGVRFQDRVPAVEQNLLSIRAFGEALEAYDPTYNEFLSMLINRIGRVMITSKSYSNPYKQFKKGVLAYGEAIEEIFVVMAKAHNYDMAAAENNVYKREIPDVPAAYHKLNSRLFYKTTVSNEQIRLAFLNENGIVDLIGRIVDSLYSGSEVDEYLTMKQLIVNDINAGNFYPINIPEVTADNAKEIAKKIRAASNNLTFVKDKYNAVGVPTHTDHRDQIIFMDSDFDATMDVDVLAFAFNMSKAEFLGQRVLIDDFADLTGVHAAIVDRDYFMVFDSFMGFTQNYNGEGLYWNYWLHKWMVYATSPFCNAVVFTTQTPGVTSVTVTPATKQATAGEVIQFSAAVVTTGYASKDVKWTTTAGTIDATGKLTVPGNAVTADVITVTATSVYDATKLGTAKVTIK